MFVGLDGGIDGLIHLSDLSWTEAEENAVQKFQKGQDVQALILAMDPLKERISLGIKQLEDDPVENFIKDHPKGTSVKGIISNIEAGKVISGFPAIPNKLWLRCSANFKKQPEIAKAIRQLDRKKSR